MIFVGGGGCGFFLVAVVLLLVLGGGEPSLLLLLLVVAVPVLLVRSSLRAPRRGVATGGTWSPPQSPPQVGGWQPPQEPVLPRVSAADVSSLRDRLGHDVSTLQPGEDPVARQGLADAAERHATAGTLLERATTDAQLRTAWLAAVEGLQAAKVVRRQLGLDPGPPVPVLPASGPQLTAPAQLEVGGRRYTGTPTYAPGHPHWFPGGNYDGRPVPGGWYDAPFWPAALVLGGLGGWALGGLTAGAVYGDELGSEQLGSAGEDGGEDWGGGGGGDGGGSGWGDGGGGGGGGDDWGGGGWGDGGGGGGGGDDWGSGGGGGDWGDGGGDW